MMKKSRLWTIALVTMVAFAGCKKTPDYLPVPYACLCGSINWLGSDIQLLDANYILVDSTVEESRRYYITSDVNVVGEFETHGLNTIIEIADLDGGGNFYVDEEDGEYEFAALIEEFNVNDPLDSLRQFVPVEGVVQVSAAPITGGNESVSFQLVLREVEDGELVGANINYSGYFTVYVND